MIPIAPAPAPVDFDARVRERGLDAIAELVGEAPSRARNGPKRKKVAATRATIPASCFPPLWREVLPDMLRSYQRTCAYLALYIEHATGSPSVDHVTPKSRAWDRVYEWSNYRLAAALINSKKNDLDLVLDPFAIDDGLFALELVEFQITAGASAVADLRGKVDDTIRVLGLNHVECCAARREYVEGYDDGPGRGGIDLPYLERRAPFVARELRRQNRLLRGDM